MNLKGNQKKFKTIIIIIIVKIIIIIIIIIIFFFKYNKTLIKTTIQIIYNTRVQVMIAQQ